MLEDEAIMFCRFGILKMRYFKAHMDPISFPIFVSTSIHPEILLQMLDHRFHLDSQLWN